MTSFWVVSRSANDFRYCIKRAAAEGKIERAPIAEVPVLIWTKYFVVDISKYHAIHSVHTHLGFKEAYGAKSKSLMKS